MVLAITLVVLVLSACAASLQRARSEPKWHDAALISSLIVAGAGIALVFGAFILWTLPVENPGPYADSWVMPTQFAVSVVCGYGGISVFRKAASKRYLSALRWLAFGTAFLGSWAALLAFG